MSTRNIFYDTEFLEDGKTIDLISIGMVCDDGTEYYAVNADCDFHRILDHDWLWENVVPSLPTVVEQRPGTSPNLDFVNSLLGQRPWDRLHTKLDRTSPCVKPKWVIANEVREFITCHYPAGDTPVLWANYAAYDHVALAQLYGPMSELPKGIPMFTNDIQQLLDRLPASARDGMSSQWNTQHDALDDARFNRYMHEYAVEYLTKAEVPHP